MINSTIDNLADIKNKISGLLDTFSLALKKKGCVPEVLDLLHRISFYSEQFFLNACLFHEKYQIVSYKKHEDMHNEFVKNLMQFQERLENGENMLSFDLYDYVTNWFNEYLIVAEKEILEKAKNAEK